MVTRVGLEVGSTWVFASALDWPGWCRRGRGEDDALEVLERYAERYRAIAGRGWRPGPVEVVGRVAGDATTDFGAPGRAGPWDDEPLGAKEAARLTGVLVECWDYFDRVVQGAPAALRKGPRGGGRDRDRVVEHVREAERTYGRKVGARVPPRTPWGEQRGAIVAALDERAGGSAWTPRYFIRRAAWHVTDHAWEIEDKS
ncbi:MAG TPA: hypothetical protein VL961_03305 [Acidimicrobiales bacterium]|nr:hypothetical protein [Acidimicrobiales bacterium]